MLSMTKNLNTIYIYEKLKILSQLRCANSEATDCRTQTTYTGSHIEDKVTTLVKMNIQAHYSVFTLLIFTLFRCRNGRLDVRWNKRCTFLAAPKQR
jgi:hypothetical protein